MGAEGGSIWTRSLVSRDPRWLRILQVAMVIETTVGCLVLCIHIGAMCHLRMWRFDLSTTVIGPVFFTVALIGIQALNVVSNIFDLRITRRRMLRVIKEAPQIIQVFAFLLFAYAIVSILVGNSLVAETGRRRLAALPFDYEAAVMSGFEMGFLGALVVLSWGMLNYGRKALNHQLPPEADTDS